MRSSNVMMRVNRSAGVPEQALNTIVKLAKLEQTRRYQLARNDVYAAGRTLNGMAQTFATGPSLEELKAVISSRMSNGGTMSGREYHQRAATLGYATYNITSNAPDSLKMAESQNVALNTVQQRVSPALAPFVQGGVQAAAYHYGSSQQRYVGSGLGAVLEMSTAEKLILENNARNRASYMMVAATFAGLGKTAEEQAQIDAAQAKLCQQFPNSKGCPGSGGSASASGEGGGWGFDFGKMVSEFQNMNKEEAKKHAEFWILGTLKNWFWAGKKDIAWAWCSLSKDIRNYTTKDGFKPVEWAFKEKARITNWAWDSTFTSCRKGGGAYNAASFRMSQQFRTTGSGNENLVAETEDGNTTMLIVGGVAVLAALFFVLKK